MATHDYVIANASGAAVRQDINNALAAIVSNNSSANAPATTYAFQFWFDTTNNILKIRNAANSAWIDWITTTATVLLPDGTGGSPSLTFAQETDTGLYRNGANTIGITTSGTQRVEISDTGIIINDASDDTDVRIESNNNANLVFIDGGNDRVGIGFTAEQAPLEVQCENEFASSASTLATAATTAAFRVKGSTNSSDSLWMGVETSAAHPYIQGANGIGSASKDLLLNPFGGDVGIGTTAPGAKLSVFDSSSVVFRLETPGVIAIAHTFDGTDYTINNNDGSNGHPIIFGTKTSGGESMRIDSSGNVGIGTTSPGFPLHVKNAGSSACRFVLENSGSASNDSTQIYSQNNDLVFVANDSDAMRIDSSQRVLIGTGSNFVRGNLQVVDSGGGEILIARNDTSVEATNDIGHIFFGSNDDPTGAVACASISCLAPITHATGSSPTELTFSTTATGSNTATERLKIGNQGHLFNTCNDNSQVSLTLKKGSAGDAVDFFTCLNSSNGEKFTIKASGNAENANNSYGSTSDAKLKENIVDASSQWDDIKAVQIRNYNFKEDTGYETHTQIGVIAQELETVSPGLVSESPDRETVQVPVLDENGEAVLDENGQAVFNTEVRDLGTVTKSVKQSVLYMKAVKALQEAMDRIETLEAKVAALEAG